MPENPYCFVIQPFDSQRENVYDKRYQDVFSPAIIAAGYQPYRVDQDPGVEIPIETIEKKIRGAAICFAEISTPNPNVWCEVGYARALGKKIIYVSEKQPIYPFDIRHLSIIEYQTTSSSDYSILQNKITERMLAYKNNMTEEEQLQQHVSSLIHVDGLDVIELLVIKIIIDSDSGNASKFGIRNELENLGIQKTASFFAIEQLLELGFLETIPGNYTYEEDSYCLSKKGKDWAKSYKDKFSERNINYINSIFYLKKEEKKAEEISTDDMPF